MPVISCEFLISRPIYVILMTSCTFRCMTCGNIVSDTVLSAEIEFGEGGGGAAFVQGSFVADNASQYQSSICVSEGG